MKAILTYENYLNLGKQYQVKFIYETSGEIKRTSEWIIKMKKNGLIHPYYQDKNGVISYKNSDVIGGTNIPKDILLPFISMLISLKNVDVIIGNEEYSIYEQDVIEKAIEKLHINITLFKGIYFGLEEKYFITFKYANEQQINEISYAFTNQLNQMTGINSMRVKEGKEYIVPFLIDENGRLILNSDGIIGGTNIPEDLLEQFLKIFVEQHNAILTIGNEKFKDTIDEQRLNRVLNYNEAGMIRTRKFPFTEKNYCI